MALESGEQHVPQLTPFLAQELLRRHPEEPPLPHHLHLQGHPLGHPLDHLLGLLEHPHLRRARHGDGDTLAGQNCRAARL